MNKALLYVRSFFYWIGLFLSIIYVSVMSIFLIPFSRETCYRFYNHGAPLIYGGLELHVASNTMLSAKKTST